MAAAVRALLKLRNEVEFTFAGDGPEKPFLLTMFKDEPRVRILQYHPEESSKVHLEHHIAVIPSLGSEGTTLAAAEAMGAGCAVVAAPVGGLTNMIIDGYNGVFAEPTAPGITEAVLRLIDDADFRGNLIRRAHQVASESFGIKVWRWRWQRVVETLLEEQV
jgi:glycosyltransferase involved in cell wall biosynthesis